VIKLKLWGKTKKGQSYIKEDKKISGLQITEPTKTPESPWFDPYGHNDQRIDNLLNSKGTIKNSYGLWIDGKLIVPNKHHPLPESIVKRIAIRDEIDLPETIKRLRGWDTSDARHVIQHSELFKKPHECSACNETFDSESALERHARRYHR